MYGSTLFSKYPGQTLYGTPGRQLSTDPFNSADTTEEPKGKYTYWHSSTTYFAPAKPTPGDHQRNQDQKERGPESLSFEGYNREINKMRKVLLLRMFHGLDCFFLGAARNTKPSSLTLLYYQQLLKKERGVLIITGD